MQLKLHIGDIKRPATGVDSRGQVTGVDTTVASSVPFALRPLRGREREIARQEFASASVMVTMHTDPTWALTSEDKIVRTSGPNSGRELNIGYVFDEELDGRDTKIICGEAV